MNSVPEESRRNPGEATRRWWPRRILATACLIGGFGLTAWLVLVLGAPAIGAALRSVGGTGLLAISAFHLIATTLMGLAWWNLLHAGKRRVFIWGRLVRDAGSEILPLSQIGGYILGARAAAVQGVRGAVAAASMVVDASLEFCAQIAFTAFGLALLLWLSPGSALIVPVSVGLVMASAAAATFVAIQRRGPEVVGRGALGFLRNRLSGVFAGAASMQSEIREIHRSNSRLFVSFLLHLLAWLVAAIEAWLALRLMGATLGLFVVLTLESLLYAARSLTFVVPAALGVQEGAYVLLGSALGLTPDLALALSLLKRGRDLILGVPALVTWQLFETRHQRNAGSPLIRNETEGRSPARGTSRST